VLGEGQDTGREREGTRTVMGWISIFLLPMAGTEGGGMSVGAEDGGEKGGAIYISILFSFSPAACRQEAIGISE